MHFSRFPMANRARLLRRSAPFGLFALTLSCAVPIIASAQSSQPDSDTGNAAPSRTVPPAVLLDKTSSDTQQAPAEEIAPDADSVEELRGMWVVRDSLTSPAAVHQVVVTAAKYHLNALFVQVRGRGDAWYNSPFEPRAEGLAGQPTGFDPLAQIVMEAHAQNIQVHAWLNTFLTWSGKKAPRSPQHLWNAHRDWFATDRKGLVHVAGDNACEGAFLQPSSPAVQEHLFNVFTDVAARYDVDGIHFDYCRYANTGYDYSGGTLSRFRSYMATRKPEDEIARVDKRRGRDRLAYVHAYKAEWADWRRAQITGVVTRISQAVKANKPWVQVSAAVFPDADEAFAVRGQDWRGWLRSGALDAVALMAYNANTDRVIAQTRRAVAAAGGKRIYTGIGAWHLSAHDVAHKIAAVRKAGASGVNLFSYGGVHSRPRYLDTLARGVFASRATPPRFRRTPPTSERN